MTAVGRNIMTLHKLQKHIQVTDLQRSADLIFPNPNHVPFMFQIHAPCSLLICVAGLDPALKSAPGVQIRFFSRNELTLACHQSGFVNEDIVSILIFPPSYHIRYNWHKAAVSMARYFCRVLILIHIRNCPEYSSITD